MKKKISLENLEVKSFTTSKNELNAQTVKGGRPVSYWSDCAQCFTENVDCFTMYAPACETLDGPICMSGDLVC